MKSKKPGEHKGRRTLMFLRKKAKKSNRGVDGAASIRKPSEMARAIQK